MLKFVIVIVLLLLHTLNMGRLIFFYEENNENFRWITVVLCTISIIYAVWYLMS